MELDPCQAHGGEAQLQESRQQHCKGKRGGAWAVALLCTAVWCSVRPAVAVQCSVFTPTSCWYTTALPESEEPIVFPRCAFRDCNFNHTEVLRCPFFSSGSYSVQELEECEPFMQVTSRAPPSCDVACCGGVVAGSWQSPSLSDPGRRNYVPDEASDCNYFSYSKSELIGKLLGEGIDILIAGDSMMRQHYLSLIQQLRGRQRLFDYRVHTHATYSYCQEADMFTTANYTTAMRQPDKAYLGGCIPTFFAPHSEALPEPLQNCSRRPARIDFIHSPLFQSQAKGIEAYMEAMDPKRKLLVIAYVGVWTKSTVVPKFLLETLDAVTQHPAGGTVISIGVPTYREVRAPLRAAKYRQRNREMRDWVATHPGRALYIDYEALSLTPNAPPTTANDKHYQCYTTWPRNDEKHYNGFRSQLIGLNTLRDPQFDNPVGNVWMTEDGECYDEMNRNLWRISLNALMQADGLMLPDAYADSPPFIYERQPDLLDARHVDNGTADVSDVGLM